MEAALAEGSPLVHPDLGTNENATWEFDSAAAGTGEDVEAVDPGCTRGPRQHPRPAAVPRAAAHPGVHGAALRRRRPDRRAVSRSGPPTQVPHFVRIFMALVTGTPESKIRVIAPDVGGGFGGKLQFTPEEVITFLLARQLRKPVKYTESRSETMLAGHHGRDQIQQLTLTAKRDGTVTGLKVELLADMGAYLGLVTPGIPLLGAYLYNAIYKFAGVQVRLHDRVHEQDLDRRLPWRGPARGHLRHRADDGRAGRRAGPRPARRSAHRTGSSTRSSRSRPSPVCPTTAGTTRRRRRRPGSSSTTTACAPSRPSAGPGKDPVQLGIGISTYTEMCGWAPSRLLGELSYVGGGWEHAQIRMLPTGKVEVVVGVSAHGQGHETAFSQIVADRLGVPFEDVEILHGDTQVSPRGLDTYGSRSLAVGGVAVHYAVDKVIEKAKRFAAHLLEASVDDIEFDQGKLTVRGTDKGTTLAAVAFAVFDAHNLPAGVEPNLDAEAAFDPEQWSVPHGTHLCAIEVDTETGRSTDPPLRGRRRRRDRGQPAHRRRPGPRRSGPGRGPGAVRGGLPRRGRHADDGHASPTTTCPARPTCPAGRRTAPSRPRRATRSASRASARRARSPRPPRSSTRSSTP